MCKNDTKKFYLRNEVGRLMTVKRANECIGKCYYM